jgi:lysyl-tRNA synthetase class II
MGILSLSSKLQERESSADSSVSKVKTMLLLLLRVKSLKSPLTRPSFTLTTLTTTTTTSATPTVSRSRRRSSSSSPTRTRTSGQDSYEFSRRSALSSLSPSSSPSKDIPCIETMYPSCPPLSSDSITSSTHLTQLTAKLPPGTFLKSPPLGGESLYTIRGRVMGKRLAGKGMLFLDVLPPFSKETAPSSSSGSSLKSLGSETVKDSPENTPCQVILKSTEYSGSGPAPDVLIHHLGLGDLVHVRGSLGKTHKGQPSLLVRSLTLLAPCLTLLPDKHKGLLDKVRFDLIQTLLPPPWEHDSSPSLKIIKELRYKNRAMDMIVNPQTLKTLSTRSKLIKTLRDQLHSKGFMELETPILSPSAGGALAKPFTTQGSASFLNKNTSSPLYLRIAPELYLKQLVIGGLPRVFEIGKQFRNEGILYARSVFLYARSAFLFCMREAHSYICKPKEKITCAKRISELDEKHARSAYLDEKFRNKEQLIPYLLKNRNRWNALP